MTPEMLVNLGGLGVFAYFVATELRAQRLQLTKLVGWLVFMVGRPVATIPPPVVGESLDAPDVIRRRRGGGFELATPPLGVPVHGSDPSALSLHSISRDPRAPRGG